MIKDKQNLKILLRQVGQMTKASLKTRYRNTWSGYLWVILSPLFLYSAQSYAFHFILKIQITNYPLFLALGLLPWIFIVSSIEMSSSVLLANGRMLKSFPIQPIVLVFSQILDNFINYVSAFFVLMIPIALWSSWPMYKLVFLIPPLLSVFVFVSSLGFLTSQLNVFFRDTKFVLTFVFQIAFYVTPIFYPVDLIPLNLRWLVDINIFYYIIKPFQILNLDFLMSDYLSYLGYSWSVSLLFFILSIIFWRRNRNELYFLL